MQVEGGVVTRKAKDIVEDRDVYVITIDPYDAAVEAFKDEYKCDIFGPYLIISAIQNEFFDTRMRPYVDNTVYYRPGWTLIYI